MSSQLSIDDIEASIPLNNGSLCMTVSIKINKEGTAGGILFDPQLTANKDTSSVGTERQLDAQISESLHTILHKQLTFDQQ